MESAFYGYYHVSTNCISKSWLTKEIEAYLLSRKCFENKNAGHFTHNTVFLTIQLMLVKDCNSWCSNDYSSNETNYISIVTSKKANLIVTNFFREFEIFLGRRIIDETE